MQRKRIVKKHITYHDEIVQGTEEWDKKREKMFTGSNASKLLTSFGAGTHAMSKKSNFGGNFHTERGHVLEDRAIKLFERIYDIDIKKTGIVTNSKYPQCLYSPDGYTDDYIIEVKCFSPQNHLKLIESPKIEVLAQIHFGQLILEKKLTKLIAYCPRPKDWDVKENGEWPVAVNKMFVVIDIKKDKDIQENFKNKLKDFYDSRRI